MILCPSGGERIHFGLRLAQTGFTFQASDHRQTALVARLPVRPAAPVIRRAKAQRHPNVRATGKRKERRPLRSARKVKIRWKDSDHRAPLAIDGNGLPQQRGIAAEPALPKSVADQRNRRPAGRLLIGGKSPTQQRRHAEGLEEPGGYTCRTDTLGIATVRKIGGAWTEGGDFREAPALVTPLGHVGVGGWKRGQARFEAWIVRPDDDQAIRIRKRQRTQQRGVNQTEDGRAGPEAERKCEHGHAGEAGVLQQLAESEFEIVHGSLSVVSRQNPESQTPSAKEIPSVRTQNSLPDQPFGA